jgi:hypothetical protein
MENKLTHLEELSITIDSIWNTAQSFLSDSGRLAIEKDAEKHRKSLEDMLEQNSGKILVVMYSKTV